MMTVKEFLFDLPLYQSVSIEEGQDVIDFLVKSVKKEVDGYNPIEQCDSTFELFCGINQSVVDGYSSPRVVSSTDKVKNLDTFEAILKCKRYGTLLHYLVHIERDENYHTLIKSLSKVGQYPSVADFHIGKVHKYDKMLNNDKMREFTKAIGLAANGVGIGSFVYLRRIFEYLVFEALEIAKNDKPDFDANTFSSAKMNTKIQMLSGYLPDYLVEHNAIYGILSKGIHELSEDECKGYFGALKASIEMILEEKLDAYQKEKRKKDISVALSQIAGEMKQ